MALHCKKGSLYIIDRVDHEAEEHYLERVEFITNMAPKNKADYDTAILYSKIHTNVKYLGCIYSKEVMHTLTGYLSGVPLS